MKSGSRIDTLFAGRTDSARIQFFRYTIVGGTAFVVDFGLLWILTDLLDVHYLISAALSFMAGLAANYALSVAWVFKSRTVANRYFEFGVFALVGVVGLLLNELILWALTDGLGFHYLASKIVSAAVVFMVNFFARRFLLFRPRGAPGAGERP